METGTVNLPSTTDPAMDSGTSNLPATDDLALHPDLIAIQEELANDDFHLVTSTSSSGIMDPRGMSDAELLETLEDSSDDLTEPDSSDEESANEEQEEPTAEEPAEWSFRRQACTSVSNFTRTCGLICETAKTPIGFFDLLFPISLIIFLVNNINNCATRLLEANTKAQARITRWKNITLRDFRVFLALLFHMGTIQIARLEDYWSTNEQFQLGYFSKHMSRNKFLLILRCLNFSTDVQDNNRLNKISRLIEIFNEIMNNIFYPDKILCIDESLVLWRGRLWCRQYMKGKASQYGIKLYLLTDQFGCVMKVIVYGGKSDNIVGGQNHVTKVVKHLLDERLGVGHSVYMDNFYNSVGLTNYLIENNTHVTGTLRANRKGLPSAIKNKKLKKKEKLSMYSNKGVCITKWNDRREVLLISSEFDGDWQTYLTKTNIEKSKPKIVLEYNKYMGGVDQHDQMMSYYNPEHKTLRWYKKLGIHMFSTILCNSHNLYNRFGEKPMPLYDFRLEIIRALVSSSMDNSLPRNITSSRSTVHASHRLPRDDKNRLKRKRCVMCYKNLKKRVDTAHYCPVCPKQPGLCLGQCFVDFHKNVVD